VKEVTIEGRQPVLEALKAGRKIKTVYIAEGTKGTTLGEIKKKAEQRGIKIRYVPRQDLEKMSVTGSEQGVIARGNPKPMWRLMIFSRRRQVKANCPLC
jgi:tRNA G18 (ribose-2'-O)-methylase SpoU